MVDVGVVAVSFMYTCMRGMDCVLNIINYFPGDGESIKDPSEEKPESEAEGVEEPVVGEEGESVDSKEEAQKDAEEHIEL